MEARKNAVDNSFEKVEADDSSCETAGINAERSGIPNFCPGGR